MTRAEVMAVFAIGGVLALAWRVRRIHAYLWPSDIPVTTTAELLAGRPISYHRGGGW